VQSSLKHLQHTKTYLRNNICGRKLLAVVWAGCVRASCMVAPVAGWGICSSSLLETPAETGLSPPGPCHTAPHRLLAAQRQSLLRTRAASGPPDALVPYLPSHRGRGEMLVVSDNLCFFPILIMVTCHGERLLSHLNLSWSKTQPRRETCQLNPPVFISPIQCYSYGICLSFLPLPYSISQV